MSDVTQVEGEGFTEFTVTAVVSEAETLSDGPRRYITESASLTRTFGRPVRAVDLAAPYDEASRFAQELAADRLKVRLAAISGASAPAVPAASPPVVPAAVPAAVAPVAQPAPLAPPAPVPTPVPPQPAGRTLVLGNKPKGGTFSYVPTAQLATQAFVDEVKAAIGAGGDNPQHYFVYDNRGDVESGGTSYSPGAVKVSTNGAPDWLATAIGKQSAYWVDFAADGTVTVKRTKELEAEFEFQRRLAAAQAQAPAGGAPAAAVAPGTDEVPF